MKFTVIQSELHDGRKCVFVPLEPAFGTLDPKAQARLMAFLMLGINKGNEIKGGEPLPVDLVIAWLDAGTVKWVGAADEGKLPKELTAPWVEANANPLPELPPDLRA